VRWITGTAGSAGGQLDGSRATRFTQGVRGGIFVLSGAVISGSDTSLAAPGVFVHRRANPGRGASSAARAAVVHLHGRELLAAIRPHRVRLADVEHVECEGRGLARLEA